MLKKTTVAFSYNESTTSVAPKIAFDEETISEGKFLLNIPAAKQLSILSVGLYSAQRDAIDLAKFLNWKLDIAGVGSLGVGGIPEGGGDLEASTLYWPAQCGLSTEEATDMIRNKLQKDYDTILFTPQPTWNKYPQDIREKVIDKVRSGSVLVMFSPVKEFLQQLDPQKLEKLPDSKNVFKSLDQKDEFSATLYRYDKGTIAVCKPLIDYRRGFLFEMSPEYMYYEYRMARIARFINNLVYRTNGEISSFTTDSKIAQIELQGSRDAKLLLAICNNDGYVEKITSKRLDKNSYIYEFELPYLPNGKHFLFARLLNPEGKALDWSANWLMSENGRGIKAIEVTPQTVTKQEPITVTMEIFGKLTAPCVKLTVSDTWDRICLQEEQSKDIENLKFNFPKNSCSVINKVNIELYDGQLLVDRKTANFSIPENIQRRDFYLFGWMNMRVESYRQTKHFKALRDFGMDGLSNVGIFEKDAQTVAESNFIGMPYTSCLHKINLPDHLFNQKWIAETAKGAADAAKNFKQYGAFAFTLGDENYVSGFNAKGRFVDIPVIWEGFQKYLQKQYSSLGELNTQWGSSYMDWENIRFRTEKELLNKYDNPSAWTDFRMFISWRFIDIQKKMRDIIKTTCPKAYIGWDGAEQYSSYDGYDWWDYVTEFDLNHLYDFSLSEGGYSNKIYNGACVKSFAKKDSLKGAFLNALNPIFGPEYSPWNLLFNGFNSLWWWNCNYVGHEVEAFNPYLKPTPVFEKVAKHVEAIKNGPGTLLKHAVPAVSEIAIHYSANNWHASTLSSGIGNHINNLGIQKGFWFSKNLPSRSVKSDEEFTRLWENTPIYGHYAIASKNAINLIKDLGLNPSMLARQQIETGTLKNYKVLVLPFVESLSDREIEEIKEFVKNGGTIIADYRCGIRDLHCKFRKTGALDEVFGIEQSDIFEVLKKRRKTTIDNCYSSSAEFDIIFSQPNIKLTTGLANGINDDGSLAFIKNSYGKGKALYCNFDLYSYFESRLKQQEAPMRELFAQFLMDTTGFCREPRVRRDDGNLAGQIRMYKFVDDNVFYLGLSRDFLSPQARTETLKIPFERDGHIYEVRSNRYFGYGNSASINMKPGEAALFAVMLYQPRAPKISGPKSATAGYVLEFKIEAPPENSKGKVQSATVNIEVFDQTGKKRSYLSKVLYLKNGKETFKLPLALTDTGKWTIKATEIVSAKKILFDLTVTS